MTRTISTSTKWTKQERSRSVVTRTIHSTLWPTILQTDTAAHKGVNTRVFLLSWLITLGLILLSIAAIVTPLGLTDGIDFADSDSVSFRYIRDESPYGQGTAPRAYDVALTRVCGGGFVGRSCPGVESDRTFVRNRTGEFSDGNDTLNVSIPSSLSDVFRSATSDPQDTRSGLFDMQYRLYSAAFQQQIQNGTSNYSIGTFRTLDTVLLRKQIELIEGLVVDPVNGGIGFRNHTLPVEQPYGASWSEDLTWLEPVTECVDTNLTRVFTVGPQPPKPLDNITIVDEGGFAQLTQDYPILDLNNSQARPQLRERAFKAAAIHNALAMIFLNVTEEGQVGGVRDTFLGKRFELGNISSIGVEPRVDAVTLSDISSAHFADSFKAFSLFSDFNDVETSCAGYGASDAPTSDMIRIRCGMLFAAPTRGSGGDSLIIEPYTEWTQRIHVCASGIRASIKTARFTLNGTASVSNVRVELADKTYPDEASKPLWGLENTKREIVDADPFWGLVDDKHEWKGPKDNSTSLWTFRSDSFWLPPTSGIGGFSTGIPDTVAGTVAPGVAMNTAYDAGGSTLLGLPDYTGRNNYALFKLWQQLSGSPTTGSKILNLIWTDLMTSAVVGTKGTVPNSLGVGDADNNAQPTRRVTTLARRVKYDPLYAIPAAIILALWLALLVLALSYWLFARSVSLHILRQLLDQTSTGRVVTSLLYPDRTGAESTAKTSRWVKHVGKTNIGFDVKAGSTPDSATHAENGAAPESEEAAEAAEEAKFPRVGATSMPQGSRGAGLKFGEVRRRVGLREIFGKKKAMA
ncbi:MAG: hypothetical protein M1817_002634 [Caeruleum heppii]|nr:MAG: hypothetical protein M1817_002634 [Caeruleum heppii]